ncbi:hypothetical protein B0J17DRAFT_633198 [Rhizoctonia solani]|nr:hypothetical protein B0J17DRAFT_633198 [Rhizoctonia solani]
MTPVVARLQIPLRFETLVCECHDSWGDHGGVTILSVLGGECSEPASKKRSSFEDSQAWFNEFQSAMNMIGFVWSQSTSPQWDTVKIPSDTILSKVLLDQTNKDRRAKLRFRSLARPPGIATLGGSHPLQDFVQAMAVLQTLQFSSLMTMSQKVNLNGAMKFSVIVNDPIAERFRDAVKDKLGHYYRNLVKPVEL